MVDDRSRLKVVGGANVRDHSAFEVQAAIFQLGPTEGREVRIDWTRVVRHVASDGIRIMREGWIANAGKVIRVDMDFNVVVLQQIVEEGSVSIRRQCLIRIIEIPRIVAVANWDARRDLWPQFVRLLVPLLDGVWVEDEVVQPPTDSGQCHLLGIAGRSLVLRHLPFLLQPFVHFSAVADIEIKQSIHGVDVDRYRDVLAIHPALHFVLVRRPSAKLLHVAPHAR
mmetsp:Transcript_10059/g.27574  ORF Transcript_10059/g.27574 Transcript_10059/m.27574 type:complete len:225 (-) Transcript_10059:635-1309(-)